MLGSTHAVFRQLLTQLLHLGYIARFQAVGGVLLFLLFQLSSNLFALSLAATAERRLHLFRQSLLKISIDLICTRVEDPVDPEIELRSIDLEYLAQFGDEFLKFGVLYTHE